MYIASYSRRLQVIISPGVQSFNVSSQKLAITLYYWAPLPEDIIRAVIALASYSESHGFRVMVGYRLL